MLSFFLHMLSIAIVVAIVSRNRKGKTTESSRRTYSDEGKTHITLDGSYTRNGDRYTKDGCPFFLYHGTEPILMEDGYTIDGYDYYGYDREGYNRSGFDKEGYGRNGYDMKGYDREGFDREGYNKKGRDRNGNKRPKN